MLGHALHSLWHCTSTVLRRYFRQSFGLNFRCRTRQIVINRGEDMISRAVAGLYSLTRFVLVTRPFDMYWNRRLFTSVEPGQCYIFCIQYFDNLSKKKSFIGNLQGKKSVWSIYRYSTGFSDQSTTVQFNKHWQCCSRSPRSDRLCWFAWIFSVA